MTTIFTYSENGEEFEVSWDSNASKAKKKSKKANSVAQDLGDQTFINCAKDSSGVPFQFLVSQNQLLRRTAINDPEKGWEWIYQSYDPKTNGWVDNNNVAAKRNWSLFKPKNAQIEQDPKKWLSQNPELSKVEKLLGSERLRRASENGINKPEIDTYFSDMSPLACAIETVTEYCSPEKAIAALNLARNNHPETDFSRMTFVEENDTRLNDPNQFKDLRVDGLSNKELAAKANATIAESLKMVSELSTNNNKWFTLLRGAPGIHKKPLGSEITPEEVETIVPAIDAAKKLTNDYVAAAVDDFQQEKNLTEEAVQAAEQELIKGAEKAPVRAPDPERGPEALIEAFDPFNPFDEPQFAPQPEFQNAHEEDERPFYLYIQQTIVVTLTVYSSNFTHLDNQNLEDLALQIAYLHSFESEMARINHQNDNDVGLQKAIENSLKPSTQNRQQAVQEAQESTMGPAILAYLHCQQHITNQLTFFAGAAQVAAHVAVSTAVTFAQGVGIVPSQNGGAVRNPEDEQQPRTRPRNEI